MTKLFKVISTCLINFGWIFFAVGFICYMIVFMYSSMKSVAGVAKEVKSLVGPRRYAVGQHTSKVIEGEYVRYR